MTESQEFHASCLCGAVKLTAAQFVGDLGACHCNTCRKWGGGPFLAVACGTDVQLDGEENVTAYDSSAWAQRGFCKHCGTHLFYRLKEDSQYVVPIGLFDNYPQVSFDNQIFIDEKPEYYAFANQTTLMTGAEFAAKYGSSAD